MEYWELWDCNDLDELVDRLREDHDEEDLLIWLAFQSKELETQESADPSFRATITPERFWLRDWSDQLNDRRQVRQRMIDGAPEASIVDLWTVRSGSQRHLISRFLLPRQPAPESIEALVQWAGKTGHSKVWLADRVVDPEVGPDPDQVAEVDCPSCGTIFQGEGFDFWGTVVEWGRFPSRCPVCGGELPQWETEPVVD